jgi:hypothetical protein
MDPQYVVWFTVVLSIFRNFLRPRRIRRTNRRLNPVKTPSRPLNFRRLLGRHVLLRSHFFPSARAAVVITRSPRPKGLLIGARRMRFLYLPALKRLLWIKTR